MAICNYLLGTKNGSHLFIGYNGVIDTVYGSDRAGLYLKMEHPDTLLKFLRDAGLGSRRKVVSIILAGRVKVNGDIVSDLLFPVVAARDKIEFDGKAVHSKHEANVYLVLNKPRDILSTTHDDRGRRTVIDILPERYRHKGLYPVGRLDKDSTGLLLLTNDGELAYLLTHPKFEHEKEYLVFIKGRLSHDDKQRMKAGLLLDDGVTCPAMVREVRACPPFNYGITIHEGRKRQIRRMFVQLGYHVFALKRTCFAGITLGDIREGEVRELGSSEVSKLCRSIPK